jgi:hypothetical protein
MESPQNGLRGLCCVGEFLDRGFTVFDIVGFMMGTLKGFIWSSHEPLVLFMHNKILILCVTEL